MNQLPQQLREAVNGLQGASEGLIAWVGLLVASCITGHWWTLLAVVVATWLARAGIAAWAKTMFEMQAPRSGRTE